MPAGVELHPVWASCGSISCHSPDGSHSATRRTFHRGASMCSGGTAFRTRRTPDGPRGRSGWCRLKDRWRLSWRDFLPPCAAPSPPAPHCTSCGLTMPSWWFSMRYMGSWPVFLIALRLIKSCRKVFCIIKTHIWFLRILKFGWLQISETGGGPQQRGRTQGAKKPTATPLWA